MNFFEYFTYVIQKRDWLVVVTQGRVIIFKKGSYICCFENVGNINILKEILANNEMGFLGLFLNSFKKLFGMFAGPNTLPAFNELIVDVTSSLSIALNGKVSSTRSER